MQDHHQLEIWNRAKDYAVSVYRFSALLPGDERFNLTAQLRRAATSAPLNVAEGAGCSTDAEFGRFLGYAYRSVKEVTTCLELCARLHEQTRSATTPLIDEGSQIARMTYAFMQRLGGAPRL